MCGSRRPVCVSRSTRILVSLVEVGITRSGIVLSAVLCDSEIKSAYEELFLCFGLVAVLLGIRSGLQRIVLPTVLLLTRDLRRPVGERLNLHQFRVLFFILALSSSSTLPWKVRFRVRHLKFSLLPTAFKLVFSALLASRIKAVRACCMQAYCPTGSFSSGFI